MRIQLFGMSEQLPPMEKATTPHFIARVIYFL